MKKLLLIVAVLFSLAALNAQNTTSGTVYASYNGGPYSGSSGHAIHAYPISESGLRLPIPVAVTSTNGSGYYAVHYNTAAWINAGYPYLEIICNMGTANERSVIIPMGYSGPVNFHYQFHNKKHE